MYYYKTDSSAEGIALCASLKALCTEGEACDQAAADFARDLGAASYIPAVGSDYGGVSALVFPADDLSRIYFDPDHIFVPVKDSQGLPILSDSGTPYFIPNFIFRETAVQFHAAHTMRNRPNIIISEGKLRFTAVMNMLSRTEIIRYGLKRKPKHDNEYQTLKFRYQHARSAASARGREAEDAWLKDYAALVTADDFRRMFPDLTETEVKQLVKSRAELNRAIAALEDTDWSIVIEIVPGETCGNLHRIYDIARRQHFLPIIPFGDTHRLLGSAITQQSTSRPATFMLDGTCYIMSIEEATVAGLEEITSDEYQKAVQSISPNVE